MRCYIPNGLSWSFRVIGPNLINPGLHSWKNVNNRNTNTQCRCKRPFTCSPVLAEKIHVWQWQNFIPLSLSSTKSDKEIYTPIVNPLFYRVISPTSKHSFRITTLNFPNFRPTASMFWIIHVNMHQTCLFYLRYLLNRSGFAWISDTDLYFFRFFSSRH